MITFQRLYGIFFSTLVCAILWGCSKNIQDYYNPESSLDKNIIEVLEEDGRFSSFVGIIDRLDLRSTLGEAAIYTCLAPLDEHVSAYFNALDYASIEAVPEEELRKFVNYHFINGMYYQYDIEQRYTNATTAIGRSRATQYRSRGEGNIPGKPVRFFTPYFFDTQAADYESFFGESADGFKVENARISDTDRDIGASNGVIHVLETPLSVLPRTDIALANDPETTLFSSWQENHAAFVLGEKDEFGWVDTTLYKTYSVGRNLADENLQSTLLVPTNEAIMTYFEPYLPDLDNTIDSVPKHVMESLIRASQIPNLYYKSDLVSKEDGGLREGRAYVYLMPDIANVISGSVLASNSVIYKTDVLIESPQMHSVEGGIYMKHKRYSQWYWMFDHTNLNAGLTNGLSFQHPKKTLLVQSDEVWGFPLASDMLPEDREYRYQTCRTGMLNIDVREDGGFRKRFYPTDFGYVLYDDGRFYDYTGHSVALLTSDPVWERTNGTIYEIDGFLTPMDRLDVEQTIYARLLADPDLSQFTAAVARAGNLAAELQLTGFFTYTLFAPTDMAIDASGVDLEGMSETALIQWVNRYIIQNRYIFSDGVFTGQLANRNDEPIRISGAWETFNISDASGKSIPVGTDNTQGANGVLHKINQLF
ncbi:fasciclin domain-containing protein [Parapedobacter sp. 10938]|uniref:fasciclin domain-containing protein n=1 Tax=Parapedobacter flavus TaxID=3110225 RepID=UPI002DBAEC56|nr:fasciclin domain-containing protein [Parapedobacter sp. 10938]MEC3878977.1 fasciclin domain-containing protein [Parapedobacter sp. 10938]